MHMVYLWTFVELLILCESLHIYIVVYNLFI